MRSIQKVLPTIIGCLAYITFAYLLYYLLQQGTFLLGKLLYFEPAPIVNVLFSIIASYTGFLLSIHWVVFPIAAFAKIPIRRPTRWHLFSEWFSFSLTIVLFYLPIFVLNSLRVIYPISGQVMQLISFSWETMVSLLIYHYLVIFDFYINEASSEIQLKAQREPQDVIDAQT